MNHWRESFVLATFELKTSIKYYILPFFLVIFIAMAIITSFHSYLEKNFIGIDLVFIFLFTIAPIWAKPKQFQLQRTDKGLYVTPQVVMLQQLPIKQEVIIKSRFIIYFAYTLPVQLLLLILLYVFTPDLQEMLYLGPYISFAIIWLAFSVYIGGFFPASEAGDDTSLVKTIVYVSMTAILLFALFYFLYFFSGHGLVYWTLLLAQTYPIVASSLSILLAIVGFHYIQKYMAKTMARIDYF